MTTAQIICLAAIAAIVIINVVSMTNRPRVTGNDIERSILTFATIAKEEKRYVNLVVSEHKIEIFIGGYCEQSEEGRRESVSGITTAVEGHD